MVNNNLTLLIMSCDNFSDLWDGQIKQIEKFWKEHPKKIILVSDKKTLKQYSNVKIIALNIEMEWSERLNWALKEIKTEYVFFTLDDYYLIDNVKNDILNTYVDLMEKESYDYIRLRKRRKKDTEESIDNYYKLRNLNPDSNYAINFYAGLWKKDFLDYCSLKHKNAWQLEVSLKNSGKKYGAKCAICMDNNVYPILDVVRKGKLLRNAAKYFKKHGIYYGNREVNDFIYEFKLNIREFGVKYAPKTIVNFARNFMIKRGHHYFSQEADND